MHNVIHVQYFYVHVNCVYLILQLLNSLNGYLLDLYWYRYMFSFSDDKNLQLRKEKAELLKNR